MRILTDDGSIKKLRKIWRTVWRLSKVMARMEYRKTGETDEQRKNSEVL